MFDVSESLSLSPERLERNLARLPGAFRLCDDGRVFVGALPSATSRALDPDEGATAGDESGASDWPRWLGVLPYEAFRGVERRAGPAAVDSRDGPHVSSVIWRKYDAIAQVNSERVHVRGESEQAVKRLVDSLQTDGPPPSPARLSWAAPPEDGELHRRRVTIALERIAQGQLYQVNLARRFRFRVEGTALSLLSGLGPMARAPFAAAIDLGEVGVVSTSPELFLDHDPATRRVMTRPIKGTRPRSPDPALDERLAEELDLSEKERAELAMVIDIERNDLGRLAEPGSVQMSKAPHVVSHPTVHHREATVTALLRPEVTRRQLLEATLPSGSVTGAPKIAAMDLIAELESERRGLYTGALGYISASGRMRLSMAIRVLTLRDGEAHYFAGGGIVADSDPEQELQETLWKAEQLRALVDV